MRASRQSELLRALGRGLPSSVAAPDTGLGQIIESLPEPPKSRWRYLRPGDLRRLRNFEFAAKLIVEGYFQGRHRSPYFDFSSEFADYRPYTPGDEIRAIDWRAYARTDRYYIKLYRKETDMQCTVLVDKSKSMSYRPEGKDQLSKLEYASFLAAALSYLIVQQGDKAGLALGDDRLREFFPAGGTRQNLQRILNALERCEPSGQTGLAGTLRTLFGAVRRKGLLIVISDFIDDTGGVLSALNMFVHKGFSLLLFQVLTEDELHLPNAGSALFADMETPAQIVAETDSVRAAYEAEMQAFLQEIQAGAKARRMYYQLAVTSQLYTKPLEAYLTARSRL